MDPVVAVAEGASAQLRQQHDIGGAAAGVQKAGQDRRFIRRFENQLRKPFPVFRRHVGVGDGKRRTERLRHRWKPVARSFGDIHIAVYADAELGAQKVELVGADGLQVRVDRIEAFAAAESIAVPHLPECRNRLAKALAQDLSQLGQCVDLTVLCLAMTVPDRRKVVTVDRGRTGGEFLTIVSA